MKITMHITRANAGSLLWAALTALIRGRVVVKTEMQEPEFVVNGEPGIVLTRAAVETVRRKNLEAHARTAYLAEAIDETMEKFKAKADAGLEEIRLMLESLQQAKADIEPDETGRRVLH